MKILKELAYVLTKSKTRSIEIIGDETMSPDSKLNLLYEAVKNGTVNSDEEAALLLYGEEKLSTKYRTLKSDLKKRLFNTALFVDVNQTFSEDIDKIYHECWRLWAVNRVLIKNSAFQSATAIAERLIKKSIEFEFSDLVIHAALYLRKFYGLSMKNHKKYNYYNDLYKKYKEIEHYENLAEDYYQELVMKYAAKSVTINPKIKEEAEEYYKILAPVENKIQTAKFHFWFYEIQILGTMGVFDYQKTKEVCIKAIDFIENRKNLVIGYLRGFLLNKLVCHIQLKEYEEGEVTAKKCSNLLQEGSFNWFKAQEFFFMLSMHTGNYQEAYLTHKSVTKHKRFQTFNTYFQELWLLYGAYIHFLIKLGKITPLPNDNRFTTFRLGKFLNEVPALAKDKRGMNIPILILQTAFLILLKKYDAAEDRIEAIEKYCSRYLKKEDPNFRCNCFIQMLLQIPISGFHRAGVERRASRYFKKLMQVEINFSNQAHEVEVLPFEDLWKIMLQILENKFVRRRRI